MRVVMIGGFSDRGKRSIIDDLLRNISISNPDINVTIFLNGEEDFISCQDYVEHLDIEVEVFAEGCFCCGLKYELQSALDNQKKERLPSILIMTVSVITDLELVINLIEQNLGPDSDIISIYGFDIENTCELIEAFPDIVGRNLSTAGTVVLTNNAHVLDCVEAKAVSSVRSINPDLSESHRVELKGLNLILLRTHENARNGEIIDKKIYWN